MSEAVKVGDRFVSNNGRGPMHATIGHIEDGIAHMEMWNPKLKRPQSRCFKLKVAYLASQNCGWKRVEPATFSIPEAVDEIVELARNDMPEAALRSSIQSVLQRVGR